jgi:hypothetical protein
MTVVELLRSLSAIGISVSSERGHLVVEAPWGVITSDLREELGSRKAELIAALEMRPNPQDVTLFEAQNEIARLLAIAYRRCAEIQKLGAEAQTSAAGDKLASSGVLSVHGGVP